MYFLIKDETDPSVVDTTGYTPYVKARTERTAALGLGGKKAARRAFDIKEYWRKRHNLEGLMDYKKEHAANLFRGQWECEADKRALYSRVRWEMDKITGEMDSELEQRRDRLAEVLKSEENRYLDEIGMVREDMKTQEERMMQRLADLKAQKEMERKKMAHDKKEEQFRRNCEELRTLVSQKIHKATVDEGRKVVKEKREEALQKTLEDKMYAELWVKDKEAKDLKDAMEEEERRKKSMENGRFVRDQMVKNRLDKQKKLREKEHDLAIMNERVRLAALEEGYENELKKRKQAELKGGLDICTREKMKRRAREVQDNLIQDIFFLNQLVESEEEAIRFEKKRNLMHEQTEYLKYLKDQVQAAADFEREVDRMYQEELDNSWKKREEEWERERQRRRQLEREVIREVEEQIQSNLEKSRVIQSMNKQYSQKVIEQDAEDKKKALETLRLIREKNIANQTELLEQIKQREEDLEKQKRKRDLEVELTRRERQEQEDKIQKLLANVTIGDVHPFRSQAKEIC